MKKQKILLDIEEETDELTLGLVRLAKEVPDSELFFHINSLNKFQFSRIKDLVIKGFYKDYHFPRFQAFHHDSKVCMHFIANNSSHYIQKEISTDLFSDDQEHRYLLDHFRDVDYIIWTSEPFDDFSVILLPENLMFQIQCFPICSNDELFQLIQYYD